MNKINKTCTFVFSTWHCMISSGDPSTTVRFDGWRINLAVAEVATKFKNKTAINTKENMERERQCDWASVFLWRIFRRKHAIFGFSKIFWHLPYENGSSWIFPWWYPVSEAFSTKNPFKWQADFTLAVLFGPWSEFFLSATEIQLANRPKERACHF